MATADPEAAHDVIVDPFDAGEDGRVRFGQRKENLATQKPENAGLSETKGRFYLSMATEVSAKMASQNFRAERFRQASVISRRHDRSAPILMDGHAV